MKVIVLGGAGDMGSQAVEDLVSSPDVKQVTIADKNVAKAEALAKSLAEVGATIIVRPVDANSHKELVEAIRGHDVVASALGPFYRYEVPLVRASLEAGADYVSICDDWIAAQRVIEEFHTPAQKAGRIIITGLGASPGLSNLGVRWLSQQFDRIRKVEIGVYMPMTAGEGMALLKHVLFIYSGKIPIWQNSRRKMVPAGSIVRDIEFPKFGKVRCWNVGHTEPITLPRFIPSLEEVLLLMGMGPGTGLFVTLCKTRLFATPSRIDLIAGPVARLMPKAKPGAPKPEGAIRIDAEGERGGKTIKLLLCGTAQMRPATGIPLSIGAQWLAKRQLTIKEGGVYAPEAVFDPQAFFRALTAKGIRGYTDLQMTKPLS